MGVHNVVLIHNDCLRNIKSDPIFAKDLVEAGEMGTEKQQHHISASRSANAAHIISNAHNSIFPGLTSEASSWLDTHLFP